MANSLPAILLLGLLLPARAEVLEFDEYQVKAAFLYNFAKFVEWPPGTFANSTDSIRICIIGQDPFGSALENIVQGKKIGDQGFALERLPDTQQAGHCQILFIGAGERKRSKALLARLNGAGILTVGETGDFTALGGIVGFSTEGKHVRIRIALETAERAKLRISSKLLSLAEIVPSHP